MICWLTEQLPCAKQLVCWRKKRCNLYPVGLCGLVCGGTRFAVIAGLLVLSLAACQGTSGNAFAGPNPGGGFPCPHNAFEDCAER